MEDVKEASMDPTVFVFIALVLFLSALTSSVVSH